MTERSRGLHRCNQMCRTDRNEHVSVGYSTRPHDNHPVEPHVLTRIRKAWAKRGWHVKAYVPAWECPPASPKPGGVRVSADGTESTVPENVPPMFLWLAVMRKVEG